MTTAYSHASQHARALLPPPPPTIQNNFGGRPVMIVIHAASGHQYWQNGVTRLPRQPAAVATATPARRSVAALGVVAECGCCTYYTHASLHLNAISQRKGAAPLPSPRSQSCRSEVVCAVAGGSAGPASRDLSPAAAASAPAQLYRVRRPRGQDQGQGQLGGGRTGVIIARSRSSHRARYPAFAEIRHRR